MYIPNNRRYYIVPRAEAIIGSPDALLRCDYLPYNDSGNAEVFEVYIDGDLAAQTSDNEAVLSGLQLGVVYRVDVLPLSRLSRDGDFSGYIWSPPHGERLKITVPAIDLAADPDFYAYRLYWSADGSAPTNLYSEQVGAPNNVFFISDLTDGVTYRFRATLVDWLGNESAYGATAIQAANTMPQPVDAPSVVYSAITRRATLTADEPDPQDADVVAYRLYGNHLLSVGLQQAIHDAYPLIEIPAGGTLTWASPILFAGLWRWAWRAVDGTGLESAYEELTLALEIDGSDLVEVATPPAAPLYVDAVPIAGAKIRVTISLADAEAADTVSIYLDGSLDGSALTAGESEVVYDTDALTDGQTYIVTATASLSSAESALSEAISVTADGAGPTGDLTLTVEVLP